MIEQVYRQQLQLQKQFDSLLKPEKSVDLISPFLSLPGLVGFWPMSSVQRSTGNAYDLSGQARTLTYKGNPAYKIFGGFAPYIDFDGTGDYLSRADETDLDILGTETIFTNGSPGLTLGGWFYFDRTGTLEYLISKRAAAGQISYYLSKTAGNVISLTVSSNGTAETSATTTATITTGTWYYLTGQYAPGVGIYIKINMAGVANTTSIPASIFNSTAPLQISGYNGANNLLQGNAALCFLCANVLPDAVLSSVFQQTRAAFWV